MIIKELTINNVPLVTYEKNLTTKKPLIFFFHGFTSNKDSLMGRGEKLAELGFYVVAIDAYLHGKREEEWFKRLSVKQKYQYIVEIEIKTAHDAKELWESHFSQQDFIIGDSFNAYGVSMGAATVFYLATITKELHKGVSLVGSPSFYEYYQERQKKFSWPEAGLKERLKKYYKLDPLINNDKLGNQVSLFVAVGKDDPIVNPKYSQKLFQLRPDIVTFKSYNTGHDSTTEMLNDSYTFLTNNI
ncbi:MAG: prolyl oligopeptidase family serine peptidase [Acholeplasmataceae bacterium]|jgi:pimeloyl-ACP methyl ester carboxylesterase|nr:prolyl oligopeptidase family serine peptidase [Acholeplasmataceae bacterium]